MIIHDYLEAKRIYSLRVLFFHETQWTEFTNNDRLSDTCRACWEKKKNEKEREGYVSVLFNDDEPVLSVCALGLIHHLHKLSRSYKEKGREKEKRERRDIHTRTYMYVYSYSSRRKNDRFLLSEWVWVSERMVGRKKKEETRTAAQTFI